ncbi:glycosyltransferase [Agarivorans litoreus]|uniref:glycosyltransferase n=1 Tax=Agarivorans litoreus TaxID=1510455 RepID=UPI001C7DD38D|nr:glycosyltransferase [Agarivorans litoreus]
MKIVISGVNLVEGGPLRVLKDIIKAISDDPEMEVVCLVHDISLFSSFDAERITFIEYPSIKKSWLKRIWFEYVQCKTLNNILNPDVWLAMHDISPRVSTPKQFVYCHNPSPFYASGLRELKYEPRLFLFTLFYKWLYKFNIKSNTAVIVQQRWIGQYLQNTLGAKKYIVAKPLVKVGVPGSLAQIKDKPDSQAELVLFYPALARTFKNFELILDAMAYLNKSEARVYKKLRVRLTIDAGSNRYASSLIEKYGYLSQVDFLGMLSYEKVNEEYSSCDVVVFPSKLETWGLPISEAKHFSKPIILSDLPYAHETLGNYDKACFVEPDNHVLLAEKLKALVDNKVIFKGARFSDDEQTVQSWSDLILKIKN